MDADVLAWVETLEFEHEADRFTFGHYVAEVRHLGSQLKALDAKIEELSQRAPYAEPVAVLPGVDTTTAMTAVTELHNFERFETAPQLMSFLGLAPSEYSSVGHHKRGSITKAGNAHVRRVLVEAAWHYRRWPRVGHGLDRSDMDLTDRTWT